MNELVLFEIDHHVSFGVHVYGSERGEVSFLQATSLYHPDTVERSLKHDGSGTEPGLKDDDGKWDLRPHSSRIQHVDLATLGTWHAVLESKDVPIGQSRMVYTVNKATAAVLTKVAESRRIGDIGLQLSIGWNETIDRGKGRFGAEWRVPESWDSVILQGPHLHVATPFYKQPNPTMRNNQDWTAVDLEALPTDSIPATQYQPIGAASQYDSAYTHWLVPDGQVPARRYFRIAWRAMAANTGERTLIPAIIPPGTAHPHTVSAAGRPDLPLERLVEAAGFLSSLVADFVIRAVPKSGILLTSLEKLPMIVGGPHSEAIIERVLRLTCLTRAWQPLWEEVTHSKWRPDVPWRLARDRRQALVEIDALVALSLNIGIDDLVGIYRSQFPVLRGYDRDEYLFDANGRLVPSSLRQVWKHSQGTGLSIDTRTVEHPGSGIKYVYEMPFEQLDRTKDLRIAYSSFE